MRIGRFFRRRAEDVELTQEIEAHIAQETDDNVARGMSREEGRRRALIKFGSARNVREDVWEWNTVQVVDEVLRDLRYAVRRLRRAPGFALAVILVIGLGIGANTALFTIVRSVLLKPLPFKEPNRLIRLYEHSSDDKYPYDSVSGGVFAEWKKQSQGFSDLAIESDSAEYSVSGAGGQLPEKVRAVECSWNLFGLLGVAPALGRGFSAADDEQARAELSVITKRVHDQQLEDPYISKAANSRPLLEGLVGDLRKPLYMLLAATGCLFLIACLNVASLLVARGAARRNELAIR